tara:strand:+ start:381 stop:587 length:207 start_codon:yes stop_codon:yes gene_type:complete
MINTNNGDEMKNELLAKLKKITTFYAMKDILDEVFNLAFEGKLTIEDAKSVNKSIYAHDDIIYNKSGY